MPQPHRHASAAGSTAKTRHRHLRLLLGLLVTSAMSAACSAPRADEARRAPGNEPDATQSARASDDRGRVADAIADNRGSSTTPASASVEAPAGTARGSVPPASADALGLGAAHDAVADARAAAAQPAAAPIELPPDSDPAAIVLEARAALDAGEADRARQLLAALARNAEPRSTADTAGGDATRGDGTHTEPPASGAKGAVASIPLADAIASLPPAGRYVYGLALEAGGLHAAAAEAFTAYGEVLPEMADVAWMAVGNARFAAGQTAAAAEAFDQARALAVEPGDAFLASLRLGNAELRRGRIEAALDAYADAEARAQDDPQRAQALAGRIATELEAGRVATAMATRQRLLRELPETSLASAALARLREAGEPVEPAVEAAVLAGAGDRWAALILLEDAIDARIASGAAVPSDWRLDQVGWYAALGEHSRAVELAEAFLRASPADPLAPELGWQRARSLERLGRDTEAVDAYLVQAESWPADARAGEALWRRAWLLAKLEGPREAADAFDLLAARLPDDSKADEARFRAGLARWEIGDEAAASSRWIDLLEGAGPGSDRSRAAYWLGRQAWDAGRSREARERWEAAVATDPMGFHGMRAAARLARDAALLLAPAAPAEAGSPEAAFDGWRAIWSGAGDLATARAALATGREVRRAEAWRAVGEPAAARRELRKALSTLARDPAGLAALASWADADGLTDVSIAAASEAIRLAPADRQAQAPLWLARLAYPTPYAGALLAESAARDIPPSLMLALVRQESRFDPGARSSAGALGLTQVMPETGRQVAVELGVAGFAPNDLLAPETALRFGAAYLAAQLERFDGRAWPALAAYNGGPGNADRWWSAAGGDIDRFAEIIDFSETRRYLRLVAEPEAHYRRLYPELD